MRNQISSFLILELICLSVLIWPVSLSAAQVRNQSGNPVGDSPESIVGKQGLRVGAAEAVITPSPGTFLAGYGNDRKSTGVHDDLYAKAVVISDRDPAGSGQDPAGSSRGNTVVLVTIDCIGLPFPVVQQIREATRQQIPSGAFDVGHIVVSSTHTHSGPDVIGLWGADVMHSGIDDAYTDFLVSSTAGAIVRAWESLQPAEARYAVTTAGEGWVENISVQDELDKDLTVLQFRDAAGHSIATLTNFACHPTILDGGNTLVSADFPSGFYKQMQTQLTGVNLYLQGAIGGWVQPENLSRSFEAAEEKGEELARIAIRALAQSQPLQGHAVHFVSKQFEFPVSNQQFQGLARAGVLKREFNEGTLTEIAWFSVGDAMFATHPGETSPLYSMQTKTMMQTSGPKFVLGLGQDLLGYILKPEFFQSGTTLHGAPYLTGRSPHPDAGANMMQVLEALQKEHALHSNPSARK